ncbi:hypothetical protein SAMN02745900_04450 [Pseudomonas sp. URIL14HWK12:I8]|uniref:hypothetical protein n=1 Tax=unclassified Pseudomonas TaxID=196821 RepID=UPI00047F2846|nr:MULTISPECIES: hypothetical protein [unclassified Pseudomonas]SNB84556.1 hypothetical protein SAMN02745900_04450 [Pseudomonas sp. URIL14HWK12:I8]
MTSAIEAIGLIIDGSRRLEHQLREVGAVGTGLKELSESVDMSFTAADRHKMRSIIALRNKISHEKRDVAPSELARYLKDVEFLLAALRPVDDPDAVMRKRIKESDVIDDEMAEWINREAAKRVEALRASAPDAQPSIVVAPAAQPVPVLQGSATTLGGSPMAEQLKNTAKEAALKVAVRALVSLIK